MPEDGGICFCRAQPDKNIITCSIRERPYEDFHISCLGLESVTLPKTWYCPHCSRLPQFKRKRGKSHAQHKNQQNALLCDKVCVCEVKATSNDRLLECHSQRCRDGKFFHLGCLGLKRMPNNYQTTWQCPACRKNQFQPTTYTSSSSGSESENEVEFVKKTVGSINKTSVHANLTSTDFDIINDPNGCLDCSIIQQAQVLLQQHDPLIDGLQRPTLGRVCNFDIASGEFIQILHTGSGHWLCISSVGCSPRVVHLFDSFYNYVILTEVEVEGKTQD